MTKIISIHLPHIPHARFLLCLIAISCSAISFAAPIDREALVKRHNPISTKLDPLAPFSVGNGEFAFTADITGMQTFPDDYRDGIALHTQSQWGWDYPMIAMTVARVGRPDAAIDALLMDAQKNIYLPNGHNYQDKRLPLYLPGNGGLLAAVAMMAAGWDDAPSTDAPGFPKDGTWKIRSEGLRPMP